MEDAYESEGVAINVAIYAEVSAGYDAIEDVKQVLTPRLIQRLENPYEAAFLAGKAFQRYRRLGGTNRSPLPDFFIGAHAEAAGLTLLTRDTIRYKTYFPAVRLIAP